jgi:hypothetical protein
LASIDDVLKVVEAAPPREKSIRIPLDPNMLDRLAALEDDVRRAKAATAGSIADPDIVEAAKAARDAYRDEIEPTCVTFTFRELKRPEYVAIVRRFPSSDPRYLWDQQFEPALVAASCIDPHMDFDQAMRLFGSLGNRGWSVLFVTAKELQEGEDRVPFGGNGSDGTPGSGPSSTIADPEG